MSHIRPKTIRGWLFDLYPSARGITLWLIDEEGNRHCCRHDFKPSFYLSLNSSDMRRAETLTRMSPIPITTAPAERKELYSGESWRVLQVTVHDTTKWREAVWYFEKFFPHFAFFNSDIPVPQLYFYHTRLFPLAFGEYRIDEDGLLLDWTLDDSIDAFEYRVPPLAIMSLRNANDFAPPKYQRVLQLELSYDGTTYALEQETPRELLEAFNWHLYRFDPDIIVTEYGDATLMPKLEELSRRYRVPLLLNRDPSAGYFTSKESSFLQYGKVIHKDGVFQLAGRWHVDVDNSFTVVESDLDGLFEMARLTQLPPQHQARTAIGTGLSSLQLSWAYRNGYLVPSKKREPEEFKNAATLMQADRGGLIFLPRDPQGRQLPGYHEDVAELDFVSMYPTIMVRHNISPETVNCRCCDTTESTVPELGYRICDRRRGIVAHTLESVIAKRSYYKKMKKELKARGDSRWVSYDRRQNALKWMLVTCFGYLGYKNARFGKIEAHESVNAFSRDAILTAKEIAEMRGFRLLHAIIDCMWLKKEGATERDYEDLCREIAARTNIDISLEGIYRWILFPASKTDPQIPTANRYVGWYRHGEMKIRGIEVRRRDTPKFIKKMQEEMLNVLKNASNVREVEELVPEVLAAAEPYITLLRSGKANPMELVIRRNISQEANEYHTNSVNGNVAKALEDAGIHLAAGERIEYILIDTRGKRYPEKAKPLALYAFEDGYDIEKYTELALKAVETVLGPFGWDVGRLAKTCGVASPNMTKGVHGHRSGPLVDLSGQNLSAERSVVPTSEE